MMAGNPSPSEAAAPVSPNPLSPSGVESKVSPGASDEKVTGDLDAPHAKSDEEFSASPKEASEEPSAPFVEAVEEPAALYIEPEDDTYANDSAYGGDSVLSSTKSFTSSIFNYRVENGRTFHRYKVGISLLA